MLHVGGDDRYFSVSASQELSVADSEGVAAVAVPDAHLLFSAEFRRTGDDLSLTGSDGKVQIVPGYFKSETLHALRSANGASLSGDIVAALAGPGAPGQYAATETQPAAMQAIGHVVRTEGQVTVVRNGVSIALNNGDVLLRGDVVQTDS